MAYPQSCGRAASIACSCQNNESCRGCIGGGGGAAADRLHEQPALHDTPISAFGMAARCCTTSICGWFELRPGSAGAAAPPCCSMLCRREGACRTLARPGTVPAHYSRAAPGLCQRKQASKLGLCAARAFINMVRAVSAVPRGPAPARRDALVRQRPHKPLRWRPCCWRPPRRRRRRLCFVVVRDAVTPPLLPALPPALLQSRKVCIAVDLSQTSQNALQWAARTVVNPGGAQGG